MSQKPSRATGYGRFDILTILTRVRHMKQRPPFVLRLVALPDPVPGRVRVRRALKHLLRYFGLKCLEVAPAARQQVADGAGGPGDR
jgi:hypothetical protein